MKPLICAAALSLSIGCVTHGRAVVDTRAPPEGVGGTIAGMVTSGATEPLSGRKVVAINETTGQRYEVSTAGNGGYTVKVPAGKYRLELELQAGEAFGTRPDPTDVNVGDLDPDRNFVLTRR
jgi:hypothetical protein